MASKRAAVLVGTPKTAFRKGWSECKDCILFPRFTIDDGVVCLNFE
jgi:hypothetical protein